MELEAAYLLQQVQEDQQATSERMHRDKRRQDTLRRASLMLGQGHAASEVKAFLDQQHLTLKATKREVVELARKVAGRFDTYGRD